MHTKYYINPTTINQYKHKLKKKGKIESLTYEPNVLIPNNVNLYKEIHEFLIQDFFKCDLTQLTQKR